MVYWIQFAFRLHRHRTSSVDRRRVHVIVHVRFFPLLCLVREYRKLNFIVARECVFVHYVHWSVVGRSTSTTRAQPVAANSADSAVLSIAKWRSKKKETKRNKSRSIKLVSFSEAIKISNSLYID